ncbi:helix-turn-helix domain-containing protein [Chitinophaga rhizophila]|uniref:Helix-turn-helix domain-containing protein n=1 Tax=Chitinophaga rhizophila TaxID=2866212 RepID=A0ABS7G6C2_9BACT|nr:helix-turn-helix transcriptional regulator [Chitinophaga rhizophila]MBW8683200.1 helix-turn-helix domain-containing protein [Chitinophaga rhizophila]
MRNNVMIPVYDYADVNRPGNPVKGFHIDRTTYLVQPGDVSEPHRRSNYSLTLLLSGESVHYIDFEKYVVTAPAMIMLMPDQIYHYTGDSLSEIVNISFSQEFLLPDASGTGMVCWACMFEKGIVPLTDVQLKELMAFARLMLRESDNPQPLSDMIIRSQLKSLMAATARLPQLDIASIQSDTLPNRIVRQFNELSDIHYKDKTQVAHYADMMFVTPGHLNDTIKSALGKTAKQIIDEKRIIEAKRLLYWGEQSIKEIAGQLNFEDDGYFNRFFKKHTGTTPASFQKSIREKYN